MRKAILSQCGYRIILEQLLWQLLYVSFYVVASTDRESFRLVRRKSASFVNAEEVDEETCTTRVFSDNE